MGHFNFSGRHADDAVAVIDVDELEAGGEVRPRVLTTPGFPGINGDGRIDLIGMTGTDDADGSVRLWLINMKPSVDAETGAFLDHSKVGGNTTIELFRTGRKAEKLEHIRTFANPQIVTPNRVAAIGGETNAFYFTNDHGTVKTGLVSLMPQCIASAINGWVIETRSRTTARQW